MARPPLQKGVSSRSIPDLADYRPAQRQRGVYPKRAMPFELCLRHHRGALGSGSGAGLRGHLGCYGVQRGAANHDIGNPAGLERSRGKLRAMILREGTCHCAGGHCGGSGSGRWLWHGRVKSCSTGSSDFGDSARRGCTAFRLARSAMVCSV